MVKSNSFYDTSSITVQSLKCYPVFDTTFGNSSWSQRPPKSYKQLWIPKPCSYFGKCPFMVCKDKTNSDILKNKS